MRRVDATLGRPADVLGARWELRQLSAFASWPHLRPDTDRADSDAQRPLRALMVEHRAEPLSAVDAYREALAVLAKHGGERAFEAWKRRHGCCGGHWPTAERRLAAV